MGARRSDPIAAAPACGAIAVQACHCGQEIETGHRQHCPRCGMLLAPARAA